MSATRYHLLGQVVEQQADAAWGDHGRVIGQAAELLGVHRSTVYRQKAKLVDSGRKKRADAGTSALPLEEARAISTIAMEGYRAGGRKRMTSLKKAVEIARDNGLAVAGRVDPETGEIKPLSPSSINRALRAYGLHPEQLRQPTPHVKLKSLHPNHVWQVDGSVCVLFYLPDGGTALVELDEAVHYKNKPENLKAIEMARVIRYVLTDHTTNATLWRYYPHAETGEHTVRFLAWCMAPKADPLRFPIQGRPRIVMVDPGATSGGLVKRFCRRIGTELIVNERRRPRAKGSVEQGQNRVETEFESALRFNRREITDFDSLNRAAELFQIHYNATAKVRRHGMTRFEAWQHITAEQLVTTGPERDLLLLATQDPVERTISGNLTIEFKRPKTPGTRIWYVGDIPGALVGGKVLVHWHPFLADTAMVVSEDAEGREVHYALTEVTGTVNPRAGHWGFQADAAEIGAERKSRPDTLADRNRKDVARLAARTATQEETDTKRRRKDYVPFDGTVDALKRAKTEATPTYLPKRGTALNVTPPTLELPPWPLPKAARWLIGRGIEWTEAHYQTLETRYPAGVPEADLERLLGEFREAVAPAMRPVLKVV